MSFYLEVTVSVTEYALLEFAWQTAGVERHHTAGAAISLLRNRQRYTCHGVPVEAAGMKPRRMLLGRKRGVRNAGPGV